MEKGDIPEFIAKREFLIGMIVKGKMEDTFDIFGNNVRFKTLDAGENLEALKETNGLDTTTKMGILTHAILGRSLVSINGDFVPTVTEAKVFLGKLPPILVDEFWKCYDQLKTRRDLLIEQAIIDLKKSSRSPSQEGIGGGSESPSPIGSAPSIL